MTRSCSTPFAQALEDGAGNALREAEDAGEVKDPAAVLEAARAYAAAEKALDAIAKRKKKAEDAEKLRRKPLASRSAGDHVARRHEGFTGERRRRDDDGDVRDADGGVGGAVGTRG